MTAAISGPAATTTAISGPAAAAATSGTVAAAAATSRPAAAAAAETAAAAAAAAAETAAAAAAPAAPRLTPLEPPWTDAVAEDLRKLMPPGLPPLGLFRTLAHNPRVLGRVRRGGLLDPGSVTLRDRELVILRTTALCRAEYEWGVHVTYFAAAARLTPAQVAATVTGARDDFEPAERALLDAVDALHAGATIPDELWTGLADGRSPAQLVELVALAGQYHTISFLTNALAIALEPGAARFPA